MINFSLLVFTYLTSKILNFDGRHFCISDFQFESVDTGPTIKILPSGLEFKNVCASAIICMVFPDDINIPS